MDKTVGQSEVSNSSASICTPTHDGQVTSDSSNPAEFVNHGLLRWNQMRQQWMGHMKPHDQPQHLSEPKLSWKATYDSLFGSNNPLPVPTPLAEMVDFLMDFWELEGLYD